VSGSVRLLRRERRWIARQPWLDDYVAELAGLHRAVASAVGASMWPRPIGCCPNCGAPMYPTIGVDVASCRRCKSSWSGVALARLRLIHEQEGA
jgi:NADH pyrophosphatase NudC (nudix superfamily)